MSKNRRPDTPPAHVAEQVHELEREVDRLRNEAEQLNAQGKRKEALTRWARAKELNRDAAALRNSDR